ncbi:hypothetical protein [Pacificoceanicola onchidii]|uniref:hypothetical protein n=1 Tax=Pacificoceanicola onchidii TaxID=2562685 RepID=UPI0010A2BA59|nr:hypothetical protein [Pacificoceanicola onchidii]
MRGLEDLGRVRLSKHFFLREFLHSEIGNLYGIPNIPEDPDLAIERGEAFCQTILDPLQETFGRIFVRSGYRAPALNAFGNENGLNCAANDWHLECHIWDIPDRPIAGASIAIPWFADQYAQGRDWQDLAWWLYDHVPFAEVWFFPKLCAFNISWRPKPQRRIDSYIAPKGCLLRPGAAPSEPEAQRRARYADFPGISGAVLPLR